MRWFYALVLAALLVTPARSFSQVSPPVAENQTQPTIQAHSPQSLRAAAATRGTETSPFVEVVPTPKSAAETAQEDSKLQGHAEAERTKAQLDSKLVTYNGQLARYTWVLALFAGLQFLALLGQIVFLLLAFRESRRAGNTAEQAMIVSNRAYVHYGGCIWISHRAWEDQHLFWRIRPAWLNSGNTPTRNLVVLVNYQLRDNPLPADFDYTIAQTGPRIPAGIAPKNKIESWAYDLNGTDLRMVQDGKKYFYVYGVATYRDVFTGTPEYVTRFCVEASNITGDPEKPWHKDENPMHIAFRVYGAHNCEDGDCATMGTHPEARGSVPA